MKRILIFLLACLPLVVAAQTQKLLEINQSSFRPVHTDALSGVAIDKIAKDPSQRPCARIKMHINRMTTDEIRGVVVRTIGGNVVLTKQIVAVEGNGLIIEMTAKEQTRFYIHHDKYGDSNEVSLNLEGDKEYRIDAQLNTLLHIAIGSNIIGADVYVDNNYKGKIDSNYTLTIGEVTPGAHKIKIQHGSLIAEKEIDVNSSNIFFRIDLNQETARPQYVVFQIEPKEAIVVVDGKKQIPDAYGIVKFVLNNGSYTYDISAKDHYNESGTFVVDGKKVEKIVSLRPAYGYAKIPGTETLRGANIFIDGVLIGQAPVTSGKLSSGVHSVSIVKEMYKSHEGQITISDNQTTEYAPILVADFANVSLTAGEGFDIYINNEYKSKSSWSGVLATGSYIFEARREGYRSTTLTKEIVATSARQSYALPTPTPILGSINIDSTPAMADVYVDGKLMGHTPMILNVIIGKHTVTIRKDGFAEYSQSITIEESVTSDVNCILAEFSSSIFQKKSKKVKVPKPRPEVKKGFESMVDMSYLFASSHSNAYSNIGLNYIAGYRFNNFLYLGAGAGAYINFHGNPYQFESNYGYSSFLNPGKFSVPAYLYFRANFSNTFCSPFFALSLGGSYSPNQTLQLNMFNVKYKTISHFANPQLGINFRAKKKKMSVYFAVGFQCFTAPYCTKWTPYNATIKRSVTCGTDAHFGFTF